MADQRQDNSAGPDDRTGGAISRREALTMAVGSAGLILGSGAAECKAAPAADGPDGPVEAERRYDVIIVGGGPAGLSAALVAGRSCRRVLLCDAGSGRNAATAAVHGFFGQDGTSPAEFRRVGREQLRPYAVDFHDGLVRSARRAEGGFAVTLDGTGAATVVGRKLILATGLEDVLPAIPGLRELWGTGVIHCPFCHGWEARGRPWAIMAPPEAAVEVATLLLGWTNQLTYLTNGPSTLGAEPRDWLRRHAVAVVEDRVDRLDGADGKLLGIRLGSGRSLEPAVLFLRAPLRQRSGLALSLGCRLLAEGPMAGMMIRTEPNGATEVEGLYVVGDASGAGVPSVASAVAEGSIAAATAAMAMLTEDARRPDPAPAGNRPA